MVDEGVQVLRAPQQRMGHGTGYVHGYSPEETSRLTSQADALAHTVHAGTAYPAGSLVLEAGCGSGGQSVHLLRTSPGVRLVAVDRSARSLASARSRVRDEPGAEEVHWCQADLVALPFPDDTFDHVFVSFVLEHQSDPQVILAQLRRVLRPGGSLTVVEGDNDSVGLHPDSPDTRSLIGQLILLQGLAGGNGLFARQLQPALAEAGFTRIQVEPRTVYADGTRPDLARHFILDSYLPMVAAVRGEALAAGLGTPQQWDQGLADLRATARDGGTFYLTFFKAHAVKPAAGLPRQT
ncbi:methyltransferase domain-containing protein [Streptomyces sp. NPDC098789]|uniref:methyltransferase domain-containing protein n=1 Tax=Streptomyces sp. NPDC098789 TaxID=3366098 RepID=UPI003816F5D0